jgi:hypothetical protein
VRTKHEKVEYYSSLFSTSMKKRWQCRIYLELFAGAGKARIRESGEVVLGSQRWPGWPGQLNGVLR